MKVDLQQPILILPPRQTPDAAAIHTAAAEAGWHVEQFTSWHAPRWLRGHTLVLYAEPLFADVVTPALGLALLEPPTDWLPTLPTLYRQRTVRLTTLDNAKGLHERLFIKPAEDKCFAAGVYHEGTSLPQSVAVLPGATPVLISEPVHWEVEYRCFVLDRAVTALSPYMRDGVLARAMDGSWPASSDERREALAYAMSILADPRVAVPPALVLDVGRIAGRGWAVVEANAAWGSGIYGCDPQHILPVLARATIKTNEVSPAHQVWVRRHYEVESG